MSFGSKISFADRWFLYFLLSNFSLRSTARAYPTEHLSYCFLKPTIIGLHKKTLWFPVRKQAIYHTKVAELRCKNISLTV